MDLELVQLDLVLIQDLAQQEQLVQVLVVLEQADQVAMVAVQVDLAPADLAQPELDLEPQAVDLEMVQLDLEMTLELAQQEQADLALADRVLAEPLEQVAQDLDLAQPELQVLLMDQEHLIAEHQDLELQVQEQAAPLLKRRKKINNVNE